MGVRIEERRLAGDRCGLYYDRYASSSSTNGWQATNAAAPYATNSYTPGIMIPDAAPNTEPDASDDAVGRPRWR